MSECKHSWCYIEKLERNRGYDSHHHVYVFYCVKCLELREVEVVKK